MPAITVCGGDPSGSAGVITVAGKCELLARVIKAVLLRSIEQGVQR